MKTDRELLELAAKAAGYTTTHKWNAKRMLLNPPVIALVVRYDGELVTTGWNPLTDDGDALRLAVKLEIDLSFYTERDAKVYAQTKHLLGYGTDDSPSYQTHEYHKELYKGSDPYAATRRAIVCAAAVIGETM